MNILKLIFGNTTLWPEPKPPFIPISPTQEDEAAIKAEHIACQKCGNKMVMATTMKRVSSFDKKTGLASFEKKVYWVCDGITYRDEYLDDSHGHDSILLSTSQGLANSKDLLKGNRR